MAKTTITTKGQVTIPKRVRDSLGLRAGDRLEFEVESDGSMRVSRVPEGDEDLPLYGFLADKVARDRPVTLEEMDQAIADAVVERYRRATGGG